MCKQILLQNERANSSFWRLTVQTVPLAEWTCKQFLLQTECAKGGGGGRRGGGKSLLYVFVHWESHATRAQWVCSTAENSAITSKRSTPTTTTTTADRVRWMYILTGARPPLRIHTDAPTPSLYSPNSFRVVQTLCLVASNCFSASHPRSGDDADVRTDRGDERHHGKWSFPSSLPPHSPHGPGSGAWGGQSPDNGQTSKALSSWKDLVDTRVIPH